MKNKWRFCSILSIIQAMILCAVAVIVDDGPWTDHDAELYDDNGNLIYQL